MNRPGAACKVLFMAGTLSLFCSSGRAHLVTTGLGPVYDGISHLLLTPEDLLPLLALTLYAGLRGAPSSRTVLFLLPSSWLAGGLIGLASNLRVDPVWAAVSLLLLGGLVAGEAQLPRAVVAVLAIALGLFHGFLNGAALDETGSGGLGLVGISATVFVMVALIASFVVPLRAHWMRVAVRVLGSWLAAIGLLMLGWAFGGQA